MNIVFCVNHYYPSIGGAEKISQQIAEHLSKKHNVSVCTRFLHKRRTSKINDVNIISYRLDNKRNIPRLIIDQKPDVIFIYSDVFDGLQGILECKKACPIIISMCGANWIHKNRINHKTFFRNIHKVDHIICHSKIDRDYRICVKNAANKLSVISNGVDLSEFDDNKITKSQLYPKFSNKEWIVNVANFFPDKGQEQMGPIISGINRDIAYIQVYNDICFSIGSALEKKWLNTTVRKLSKKDIPVLRAKNKPREEVVAIIKNADVLVSSSLKEVAPIVTLESMTAKTPWVSMNVGNTEELKGGCIINAVKNSNGLAVFDGRINNLYHRNINFLLDNPQIALDGRMQIEQEYDVDKILESYSKLIENV